MSRGRPPVVIPYHAHCIRRTVRATPGTISSSRSTSRPSFASSSMTSSQKGSRRPFPQRLGRPSQPSPPNLTASPCAGSGRRSGSTTALHLGAPRPAIERGYRVNLAEGARGKPMRLVRGDLLPDDTEVLPTVEVITAGPAALPETPLNGTIAASVDVLSLEPKGSIASSESVSASAVSSPKTRSGTCRYDHHRRFDWVNNAGRRTCGLCHPKAASNYERQWIWP